MDLESLNGKYEGERVFLIGNGPSLDKTPLHRIEGEHSIAMNRISKIYSQTSWRPSIYLNFNVPELGTELITKHLDIGTLCFTLSRNSYNIQSNDKLFRLDWVEPTETRISGKIVEDLSIEDVKKIDVEELLNFWSDDISNQVYLWHSMYPAIQIANYLGFSKMYLLGTDLGYSDHKPYMMFDDGLDPAHYATPRHTLFNGWKFVTSSATNRVLAKSVINLLLYKVLHSKLATKIENNTGYFVNTDSNHFGSSYQIMPRGELSHVNKQMIITHILAKRILEEKGKHIYNSTVGGNLEVHPRVDLDELESI
ncbi:hypothetical protein [Halopenitus persicus]|uniref:hypothetical protein n=1 Tax=Halopenitus persicus TaxID=1048396 RepID=UPI0012FD5217|nr:hypothetical protein [Halopenitus persicus]